MGHVVYNWLKNQNTEPFLVTTGLHIVTDDPESPKTLKWPSITHEEMRKFLGLLLLMGQVWKENIRDYWSTDSTISTPIFPHTMSRSHFESIGQPGFFFFNPVPPNVYLGFRGPPSRLWPKCNRLLRLGRPWGAVTLCWWGGWWYLNMEYQEGQPGIIVTTNMEFKVAIKNLAHIWIFCTEI
jgi:hypothetical protein